MLTKSLAAEWPLRINVNAIAPGYFRTPSTNLGFKIRGLPAIH